MRVDSARDPEIDVVKYGDIPRVRPLQVCAGFWDSQVRRMAILERDEVLRIHVPRGAAAAGMKSSIVSAGARAGVRVSVAVRADAVYAWPSGRREAKHSVTDRQPIVCLVCRAIVKRPRCGGSRQFVCAGTVRRRSRCQLVLDIARRKDVSIDEAKRRCKAWQEPVQCHA